MRRKRAVGKNSSYRKKGPVITGMTPCFGHANVVYKKGCKDCFDANRPDRGDDHWHDLWERDNFGDRD